MSTYNDIGISSELDWKRIRKLFVIGLCAGIMVLIGDVLLGWGVMDESLSGLEYSLSSYLQLSDAFEPVGSTEGFEWTATVINIGGKHSEGLQKKCKSLYAYCSYVNRVKQNLKAKLPLQKAVEEALDYAIEKDLLEGYFKQQKMEVMNMSLTEFDQEQYDRNRRRDAYLDGRDDGMQEAARNMLADGLPLEKIVLYTGLSVEDILALEAELVTV